MNVITFQGNNHLFLWCNNNQENGLHMLLPDLSRGPLTWQIEPPKICSHIKWNFTLFAEGLCLVWPCPQEKKTEKHPHSAFHYCCRNIYHRTIFISAGCSANHWFWNEHLLLVPCFHDQPFLFDINGWVKAYALACHFKSFKWAT